QAATLGTLEDIFKDIQRPITDIMSTITSGLPFLHPRLLLPSIPAVAAPPEALGAISHGMAVNLPAFGSDKWVRVFEGQHRLVAMCQRIAGTLFQPKVVLCAG